MSEKAPEVGGVVTTYLVQAILKVLTPTFDRLPEPFAYWTRALSTPPYVLQPRILFQIVFRTPLEDAGGSVGVESWRGRREGVFSRGSLRHDGGFTDGRFMGGGVPRGRWKHDGENRLLR